MNLHLGHPFSTRRSTFLPSFSIVLLVAFRAGVSVASGAPLAPLPPPQPPFSSTATSTLTIVPPSAPPRLETQTQFVAELNGVPSTAGTWQVRNGAIYGTISSTGLYTGPSTFPQSSNVTIVYTLNGQTAVYVFGLYNPVVALTSSSVSQLQQMSTPMTLQGSGFMPWTTAAVNGVATPVTFIDAEHLGITINVPGASEAPVSIVLTNTYPGRTVSSPLLIPNAIPLGSVTPSTLPIGNFTLTVSGSGFTKSNVIVFEGKELPTTLVSSTTLTAAAYVPPWASGTEAVSVIPATGKSPLTSVTLPIAPATFSYDVASRFATQAAMGPRHDVIERIQQIGLAPFVTQQLQQPALSYSLNVSPLATIMQGAISGNSLLRERVSLALQSFLVCPSDVHSWIYIPWLQLLDRDAFGNFRQILEDTATNYKMASFMNLSGNYAPTVAGQHPDQNYGREVLQLFSTGPSLLNMDGTVQTDSSGTPLPAYSENDILDLSRALTGWQGVQASSGTYAVYGWDYSQPLQAVPGMHDEGSKSLFGTVNLPAGQTALADREAALDAVFNHPNVPPFVSRILIQKLVKSQPSPAYVERIANVFANNGKGVRGDMPSVIQAILLDPEARAGDTAPTATDGFLQDPLLMQTFAMSLLQMNNTDDEYLEVPELLQENWLFPATVFGFYSPGNLIPGTTINSPEFSLLNNVSDVQREQLIWGMVSGTSDGFRVEYSSYLLTNFTTVPEMVDAANHLLFHGTMSAATQQAILNYCTGMPSSTASDKILQVQTALFLAMNADSYQVIH